MRKNFRFDAALKRQRGEGKINVNQELGGLHLQLSGDGKSQGAKTEGVNKPRPHFGDITDLPAEFCSTFRKQTGDTPFGLFLA